MIKWTCLSPRVFVALWICRLRNRFKHGFLSKPCFQLVFHWVSKLIHLTRIRCSGWVRAAWIINEFEKGRWSTWKSVDFITPTPWKLHSIQGKKMRIAWIFQFYFISITLRGYEWLSFNRSYVFHLAGHLRTDSI